MKIEIKRIIVINTLCNVHFAGMTLFSLFLSALPRKLFQCFNSGFDDSDYCCIELPPVVSL